MDRYTEEHTEQADGQSNEMTDDSQTFLPRTKSGMNDPLSLENIGFTFSSLSDDRIIGRHTMVSFEDKK